MSSGVRLLGHRGALARVPENTLASMRRALADGADGVEFDVRTLADGTPVLMHDETVDRTTNGSGPVAALDVVALKSLAVGEAHSESGEVDSVPTLDEVLDELFGKVFLAIELKAALSPEAFERLAARHRDNRDAEALIASFQAELLAEARDCVPSFPRALILRADQPLPPDEILTPLGLAAIFARHESVDERFIVDCRRHGLASWAYPVNDPESAQRLLACGAAGLISDDPGALRSVVPRGD